MLVSFKDEKKNLKASIDSHDLAGLIAVLEKNKKVKIGHDRYEVVEVSLEINKYTNSDDLAEVTVTVKEA
ncbi:hypothetical protein [Bacillus thuringiensis]|uniref:hypothetical protein n=1 Tax=Bacillus cereus group TaxID=86661 RepID=UPI002D7F7162|nr:hypothetical protein [Bacillus thuringiensis]MEB4816168.1 hypothetical protein [Bacillus thuringiensis]